jgi:hypothetical protein
MINTARRRRTLGQAVAIIGLASLGVWAALHGSGGSILLIFIVLVAVLLGVPRDRCPRCRHDLSFLADERHLWVPELSRKVRACPFCGLDLAYETSPGAGQGTHAGPSPPPAPASAMAPEESEALDQRTPSNSISPAFVPVRGEPSSSSPRDAIDEIRRLNRRVDGWVFAIIPVMFVGCWLYYTITGKYPGLAGWLPILALLLPALIGVISGKEQCPRCGKDVSMLPAKSRLDSAITLCPYCRADLASPARDTSSPAPPAEAVLPGSGK